jgi:hypothetical protein
LEKDEPLPEKYRFFLFEDKRELELVWNGKTNNVCNVVLPFQIIEQIIEQVDEPRTKRQRGPSGLSSQNADKIELYKLILEGLIKQVFIS